MASRGKGVNPNRLTGILGCEYLTARQYTDKSIYAFIAQEDTVLTVLTGGDASISENTVDYMTSIELAGITLKQGAMIIAPEGEVFNTISIESGSVIGYK